MTLPTTTFMLSQHWPLHQYIESHFLHTMGASKRVRIPASLFYTLLPSYPAAESSQTLVWKCGPEMQITHWPCMVCRSLWGNCAQRNQNTPVPSHPPPQGQQPNLAGEQRALPTRPPVLQHAQQPALRATWDNILWVGLLAYDRKTDYNVFLTMMGRDEGRRITGNVLPISVSWKQWL